MISLITTTFNRENHFRLFCKSLVHHHLIQMIVVDQNDYLEYVKEELELLAKKGSEIVHIKTGSLSLSKARNLGLNSAKYDIVGFPDDDCIYSDAVLDCVLFANLKFKDQRMVVTFNSTSNIQVLNQRVNQFQFIELNKYKLLGNLISYTCFFFNIKDTLCFDERLGVGTFYSSAEETDYAYRFLSDKDSRFLKALDVNIFHPEKDKTFDFKREFKYALGLGAFVSKNLEISLAYLYNYLFLPLIVKPLGFALFSLIRLSFTGFLKAITRFFFRLIGILIFRFYNK